MCTLFYYVPILHIIFSGVFVSKSTEYTPIYELNSMKRNNILWLNTQ